MGGRCKASAEFGAGISVGSLSCGSGSSGSLSVVSYR